MEEQRRFVASCSFGKDSLAAIIVAEEHGIHIDKVVYCRVMFDSVISAELPEHEEFIYDTAIPLLESRYGITTEIVQAQMSYCDYFHSVYQKGSKVGQIYGFPYLKGPWCNNRLKMRPIKAQEKQTGEYVAIVGIAADEPKRLERKTLSNKYLPLVEHGVTEAQAFDLCKKQGLLSPAYNDGRTRLGCWFCHNQRIGELRRLRHEYPDRWQKLMELDEVSPVKFKADTTLKALDERFAAEDRQLSVFDFVKDAS